METKVITTLNKSKRTATIRKYSRKYATIKYQTLPFTKEEWKEVEYWTEEDWREYLKQQLN